MATLVLLTGPWGSGKTTVVRHLAQLSHDYVVFDWDMIIPGIAEAAAKDVHTDPSTWEGLKTTWLAIIEAVLVSGHSVVLCGPVMPPDLANRLAGARIRCAYLDCPDDTLRRRLHERGETEADIADELAYVETLRRSSYHAIQVNDHPPEKVAETFVEWLHTTTRQN